MKTKHSLWEKWIPHVILLTASVKLLFASGDISVWFRKAIAHVQLQRVFCAGFWFLTIYSGNYATANENQASHSRRIHDGDRIVFLGDSITEQGLYTAYIETYYLCRYPAWHVTFRNLGWGGDTSWLRERTSIDSEQLFAAAPDEQRGKIRDSVKKGLERDLAEIHPTVVFVNFGMNDHWYQAFRPDIFQVYLESQTELARELLAYEARVFFCTPQPLEIKNGDIKEDPRNSSLRSFIAGLRFVASQNDAEFVDQFTPYMERLLQFRGAHPGESFGGGDAVHPGPPGHLVMAWAILSGLKADQMVSRVTVEMNRVTSADDGVSAINCRISNVRRQVAELEFDRLDEALPMPIDTRAVSALSSAPVIADLSQYELKVTGLSAGRYRISVDNMTIADVTDVELKQGLNLAAHDGPWSKQGEKILALVFKKNGTFFKRWRRVQLFEAPDWMKGCADLEHLRTAELAKLDEEIVGLEKEIDAARLPIAHHFAIAQLKGSK